MLFLTSNLILKKNSQKYWRNEDVADIFPLDFCNRVLIWNWKSGNRNKRGEVIKQTGRAATPIWLLLHSLILKGAITGPTLKLRLERLWQSFIKWFFRGLTVLWHKTWFKNLLKIVSFMLVYCIWHPRFFLSNKQLLFWGGRLILHLLFFTSFSVPLRLQSFVKEAKRLLKNELFTVDEFSALGNFLCKLYRHFALKAKTHRKCLISKFWFPYYWF